MASDELKERIIAKLKNPPKNGDQQPLYTAATNQDVEEQANELKHKEVKPEQLKEKRKNPRPSLFPKARNIPAWKLSAKQQRFVDNYLKHGDATKAFKEAGYTWTTPENASAGACQVLKSTRVAHLIADELQKRATKRELTHVYLTDRLVIEAEGLGPDTNTSGRIRATELLAKHEGRYFPPEQKHVHVQAQHMVLSVDVPNRDEIVKRGAAFLLEVEAASGEYIPCAHLVEPIDIDDEPPKSLPAPTAEPPIHPEAVLVSQYCR